MSRMPQAVEAFLDAKRIAVAGVSRSGSAPANAVFRRLRDTGREAIPVNPNASDVEGQACYPDVRSVPGHVDAVMVVTHPAVSAEVARQAVERGVRHIWFHRSFGAGSVSPEAIAICRDGGVEPIVGGCPLMYCPPIDPGHRFFRFWLKLRHRVPG